MVSKIDIINNHLLIFEKVQVGTYRGEDSGAIYPEYQEQVISCYNLHPIKDHIINGRTISELLTSLEEERRVQIKSVYRLYFMLNEETPEQVKEIYNHVMNLSNKDNLIESL